MGGQCSWPSSRAPGTSGPVLSGVGLEITVDFSAVEGRVAGTQTQIFSGVWRPSLWHLGLMLTLALEKPDLPETRSPASIPAAGTRATAQPGSFLSLHTPSCF